MTLNPRHMLAVDAYFANKFNKAEAMRVAQYAHPEKNIWKVFGRADVKQEIERRLEINRKKAAVSEDWVVDRLLCIAKANFGQMMMKLRDANYDLGVLDEDELYALSEVTDEVVMQSDGQGGQMGIRKLKVRVESKMQALVSLCRHLGLFNDSMTIKDDSDVVKRLQEGRERVSRSLQSHEARVASPGGDQKRLPGLRGEGADGERVRDLAPEGTEADA